jgi:hypothetical protein
MEHLSVADHALAIARGALAAHLDFKDVTERVVNGRSSHRAIRGRPVIGRFRDRAITLRNCSSQTLQSRFLLLQLTAVSSASTLVLWAQAS